MIRFCCVLNRETTTVLLQFIREAHGRRLGF
jgi:hypothetical protein